MDMPGKGSLSEDDIAEVAVGVVVMMRQAQPELRPHDFMQFALDIGDLNSATDMLVFCQTKKRWSELMQEFRYEYGPDLRLRERLRLGKIMDLVRFLTSQHLLIRLKPVRHADGHEESVLKAIPRPVEELVWRLAHNGHPSRSPQPQPCMEDKQRHARDKVNEALLAAGYHTDKDRGRRLRVVR